MLLDYEQEEVKTDEIENSLETGQVSEAIHKAAAEMEAQSRFTRQIGINLQGQVKLFEPGEVNDEPEDQQRYLSYIASEAENFELLNEKYFTLDETANLLASSHHQHRLYALGLLCKMLGN